MELSTLTISTRKRKKDFLCTVCAKLLTSHKSFTEHMRIHNDEKPYKCTYCDKTFRVSKEKKRHEFLHTGNFPCVCEICGKGFHVPSKLTKHVATHGNEKAHTCNICWKSFTTASYMKIHMNVVHSGVKSHSCSLCDMSFSYKQNLTKHQSVVHNIQSLSKTPCKRNEFVEPSGDFTMITAKDNLIHTVNNTRVFPTMSLTQPNQLEEQVFHGLIDKPLESDLSQEKLQSSQSNENDGESKSDPTTTDKGSRRRKTLHSCSVCPKIFQRIKDLKEHFTMHTGEKPYKCIVCSKAFRYEKEFKRHRLLHTDEKPFPCTECTKSYCTAQQLKRHMKLHTGNFPFVCGICDKGFHDRFHLELHSSRHSSEKKHRCQFCPKLFSLASTLKNHIIKHHAEVNLETCTFCPKTFCDKASVLKHMQSLHKEFKDEESVAKLHDSINLQHHDETKDSSANDDKLPKLEGNRENCDLFNEREFSSLIENVKNDISKKADTGIENLVAKEMIQVKQEVDTDCSNASWQDGFSAHSEEESFEQISVEKDFMMDSSDKRIKKERHYEEKKDLCSERSESSSCVESSNILKSIEKTTGSSSEIESTELNVAQSFLASESPTKDIDDNNDSTVPAKQSNSSPSRKKPKIMFKCDECYREFSWRKSLTYHKYTHSGEKPFPCDICEKKFRCKSDKRKHMRTHNKDQQVSEKKHKCRYCEKLFIKPFSLQQHENTHTRKTKYICFICGRIFLIAGNLEAHIRNVHSKVPTEKPYKCNVCGYAFKFQSHLDNHMITHTGEKPHLCNYCGKSLKSASSWFHHLQKHTGKKRFQCSKCEDSFEFKKLLVEHMTVHIDDL